MAAYHPGNRCVKTTVGKCKQKAQKTTTNIKGWWTCLFQERGQVGPIKPMEILEMNLATTRGTWILASLWTDGRILWSDIVLSNNLPGRQDPKQVFKKHDDSSHRTRVTRTATGNREVCFKTPQKSNIDTNNCHFLRVPLPFPNHHFGYPAVSFRECIHDSI